MISIIIPTLNEKDNIIPTHNLINKIFIKFNINYEIIFVDDKSTDGTVEIIENLVSKNNNVNLITPDKQKGLGNALLHGYINCKGNYVLFLDCDLSVDERDIQNLIESRNLNSLIIGSRYLKQSKLININKFKIFLSYLCNLFFVKLFFIKAIDVSHSFRIFPKIIDLNQINVLSHPGFFWELTFILNKKFHLDIKEIPVTFKDRLKGVTKNSLKKMFFSCLHSLIIIISLFFKK